MAPLTRRELLRAAAAMAALPALSACDNGSSDGDANVPAKFPQGVASGDPLSDAVMLWTRAVPEDAAQTRVPLQWVVARDAALSDLIASGTVTAKAEQDYTLKLDVQGLAPGTTYYYAFLAAATRSPVGRTRTAPIGATERLRLAVVTCGDYTRGLFHAYRRIAERADLDAVIHLGPDCAAAGAPIPTITSRPRMAPSVRARPPPCRPRWNGCRSACRTPRSPSASTAASSSAIWSIWR